MFKKKLTQVAVDSFTEYLQGRFEKLKELDLDEDGIKDVDQIVAIVGRCAIKVKDTLESTNFPHIASGLEQVLSGAAMIRNAVDEQKLAELSAELMDATKQITILGQLTIKHVKEQGDLQ